MGTLWLGGKRAILYAFPKNSSGKDLLNKSKITLRGGTRSWQFLGTGNCNWWLQVHAPIPISATSCNTKVTVRGGCQPHMGMCSNPVTNLKMCWRVITSSSSSLLQWCCPANNKKNKEVSDVSTVHVMLGVIETYMYSSGKHSCCFLLLFVTNEIVFHEDND